MLEMISSGFRAAKNILRKETVLTKGNIAEAVLQVKLSLLEADVAYEVVNAFLMKISERIEGLTIKTEIKTQKGKARLSPAEHFIGICYEELNSLMSPGFDGLVFSRHLTSIMMCGLQGSGKTTTSAKLALYIKEDLKKRPLLVAADIYRPGAVEQLKVLGSKIDIEVFSIENASAEKICAEALDFAKNQNFDVVIFDTAGRLAIDEKLMAELKNIKNLTKPQYTVMVLDAMSGNDAVKTADKFNDELDLSGFILTKLDGDTRGGAAISIRYVTKKPIMFLGSGEDLKSLEAFRPEGLAGRILGMGDIVSLAKDFEKHIDEAEAEKDASRMLKGLFTFNDFLSQIRMIKRLGSFKSIIDRIPGIGDLLAGQNVDEREFAKIESMIQSMTKDERLKPDLLKSTVTRRQRVAKGCGRKIADIDSLLDRFLMMRKMMQAMGSNPGALMNSPLFNQINRSGMISKSYGMSSNNPLAEIFGAKMPGNLTAMNRPTKISNKSKKEKRKTQKLARRKGKR